MKGLSGDKTSGNLTFKKRKEKKKKTVLTEDLDEKAALNGSFELKGSATGWFVFVLLNGSETSTWHTITIPRHKIIECTKQLTRFYQYFQQHLTILKHILATEV